MKTYHFQGEEQVPSPQMIYYKDQILANTRKAIREAGGAENLWPHVKTHKMEKMIRLQLSLGIHRFKCATFAEAEMTAGAGASHIILAYPLVGPNILRFLQLRKAWPGTEFLAIGDDLEQLRLLGQAADDPVRTLVDVDTGFHRTGVPVEELTAFFREATGLPGLHLCGFHVYDGQNHQKDLKERKQAVEALEEGFRRAYLRLKEEGYDTSVTVFGGTPSMPCFAPLLDRYERAWLSPGTLFVGDYGYTEGLPDMDYPPAAAILTRVISHPGPGRFTLDLGTKGISTDQRVPGLLLDVEAEPLFQSEEHWAFGMREGHEDERPAIGTVCYVLPSHICPSTALYEEVPVVSGGKLEETWEVTAGRRKITV